MKKRIIVLGTGLVGSAIVKDLCSDYLVTAVDLSSESINVLKGLDNVKAVTADLSDSSILKDLVRNHDLVIGALPGSMGYKSVKDTIEAGIDMVDISFFPEDPFALDRIARNKGVTVVTDCGVAPGMSNIILGYHHSLMSVEKYECYVGGLPFKREWPWQYKAVFSPIDVIEEYTRPARYMLNGKIVTRDALSESEYIEFDEIGTLEAWNSDGLRSLLYTIPVPNMIEKTLRYPGTIDYLKMLREAGFFSEKEIEVKGNKVRPLDLTSALMFPQWQLKSGEEEFTVMRIILEGMDKGEKYRYQYDLFDRYDSANNITSMARTTGYTCTAVANLLMEGMYESPGINPPEFIGKTEGHLKFILGYLKERGVVYNVTKGI
ncbi:MAG: saccharopine dehydrogenase NADP-binding domain-containing protein [Bacteroidales bacterium]|nr:saccharopine dehydrogenase NADP-binding domain-containing protein [Bacteroidales bacterium]